MSGVVTIHWAYRCGDMLRGTRGPQGTLVAQRQGVVGSRGKEAGGSCAGAWRSGQRGAGRALLPSVCTHRAQPAPPSMQRAVGGCVCPARLRPPLPRPFPTPTLRARRAGGRARREACLPCALLPRQGPFAPARPSRDAGDGAAPARGPPCTPRAPPPPRTGSGRRGRDADSSAHKARARRGRLRHWEGPACCLTPRAASHPLSGRCRLRPPQHAVHAASQRRPAPSRRPLRLALPCPPSPLALHHTNSTPHPPHHSASGWLATSLPAPPRPWRQCCTPHPAPPHPTLLTARRAGRRAPAAGWPPCAGRSSTPRP